MTHHFTTELKTDGQYRALNEGWHLRLIDGPAPLGIAGRHIPALVPGTITQDLASAGILPAHQAEATPEWIAYCSWEYSLDFPFRKAASSPIALVISGLRSAAEVRLNGHSLGEAKHLNNDLRDIGSRLFHGLNTLKVSVHPSPR